MRSRVLYIVIVLLFSTTSLYPQKDGTTPLVESAIDHLYQRPARWSGSKYTTPPSILNRFYISYGVENYGVWSYDGGKSDDLNGWMNRLSVGYMISPVHSVEVGASWNDWDLDGMVSRFDASYLFNVTAFANRTEQPTRWEVLMKLGVESYLDMFSDRENFGASGAFRVKYNLSPSVGLYVEPKLSFVGGGGDFNTSLQNNLFMPSIMFGISANIGQIRDNIRAGIDYRYNLWSDNGYKSEPLFAIKTNLLFDAATLANVEIEVPVAKRWSIGVEWMFPWWLWENKQNCIQILAGTLEGRYWVKPNNKYLNGATYNSLAGWFVGLYGGGGLYDLERETVGYQGEFYIATGVKAGYVHPFSRSLLMEFSAGFGYMNTDYRKYEAQYSDVDNKWHLIRQYNGSQMWIGPTQAKVSLVWYPHFRKKGGRR